MTPSHSTGSGSVFCPAAPDSAGLLKQVLPPVQLSLVNTYNLSEIESQEGKIPAARRTIQAAASCPLYLYNAAEVLFRTFFFRYFFRQV